MGKTFRRERSDWREDYDGRRETYQPQRTKTRHKRVSYEQAGGTLGNSSDDSEGSYEDESII